MVLLSFMHPDIQLTLKTSEFECSISSYLSISPKTKTRGAFNSYTLLKQYFVVIICEIKSDEIETEVELEMKPRCRTISPRRIKSGVYHQVSDLAVRLFARHFNIQRYNLP